jgi:lysyl-tRNA synthetase class 2
MNLQILSKLPFLRDRAEMLRRARLFFHERKVMEVDCPALSRAAPIDLHIDVMKVALQSGRLGYLHTSPEYGMKRLLASGCGDIYQIAHVFRDGELGPLHNPEFTMAEWYRIGFTFEQMIEETIHFIRLFLGDLPLTPLTYRETLLHFAGIDYLTASMEQLLSCAKAHHLDLPSDAHTWSRDALLQLLMSFVVEPQLGQDHLFAITTFPASQAALSQILTTHDNEAIACRFEVYFQGIELANGYHELTDPQEQKKRLIHSNQARIEAGKEALPIDEYFLQALETGLPDCCGVAVGFDRLMMLRHHHTTLQPILPFSFEES